MFLIVFRNCKRSDIDAEAYACDAQAMEVLAKAQPGFLSFKSYVSDDGEVVALSEWANEASAHAWGRDAEHRLMQAKGQSVYYQTYTLFTCDSPRIHEWKHEATEGSDS